MNQAATIVSIITVIGCLVLATRSAALRGLGMARAFRLALIWAAIILGLVLAIQLTGLRIER
ncbi:hypothetical protein SAMN05518801_10617 [Novosphingobium sp. CF614]|uniref:hypothetical protein n=1 Tax=Novosphingobium sp. CF614 TaxID=1884364 RepID=UPI0008F20D42|nr:hypothetical protein [Novosphingobium sp. CF614]SFG03495.1 hypothetical protein SAMN05518801_10617 [Novosphingobium sp. CF614]